MNVSIALPAMAPQPTGHPASLPADPPAVSAAKRVTAPNSGGQSANTSLNNSSSDQQNKAPPPSAIQIKIMEMLEQQASELDSNSQYP